MPNSCACPVIWATSPERATIAPSCTIHGGASILQGAAAQMRDFDPECAATLDDLAGDYAGPDREQDPQVSDEEWAEAQKEFAK